MAWTRGYIQLACGTHLGVDKFDETFVGDMLFCPKHRTKEEVARMARISEARPSKFQLGLLGSETDAGNA